MLCTVSPQQRFVRLSERWRDHGCNPDGLIGTTWLDLLHPADRHGASSALARVFAGLDAIVEMDARVRSIDGCHVRCHWRWKSNESGQATAIVFEDGARWAEFERYRRGIDASPAGVLIAGDDGTIAFVNRQVEAMFGFARGELLGRSVDELVPSRFQAEHSNARARFMRDPGLRTVGLAREFLAVRKDGSEFDVEVTLTPLHIDDERDVVATIVDNSARKEQNDELRARLAELQSYQEETEVLSEMSSLLQHALVEQEVHRIVETFGRRLLPEINAAIYAYPPSRDALECRASWGSTPDHRFEPHDCWALRRTRPHRNVHDLLPRCGHGWHGPAQWQVCIPIAAHGQASGIITLSSSSETSEEARKRAERVGKAAADQLALALSNIHLRETLRALSIRDPLTGLFNRRYLEESLAREFPRARRHNTSISVLMIDVDHFKSFNDTHGHQAADQALRAMCSIMSKCVRAEDILCRYGGEEFVAVLPDCGKEDAFRRADMLRTEVSRNVPGITVSIGVAEWPVDGRTWESVLRAADEALYRAKASGRDVVRSSLPPSISGRVSSDPSAAASQRCSNIPPLREADSDIVPRSIIPNAEQGRVGTETTALLKTSGLV